jgi:hypothetical protein
VLTHNESTYISRLLKSLGETYYAARWSTDTNIYKLFQTYAGELASGSAEIVQTYDDLFIPTCRTAKLYDNFGSYLGVQKVFEQEWETDTYSAASGSWIGYRKELKFLWDAGLWGSTFDALYRVGHAFFGISPLIEPYRDVIRWRLSTVSGSVSSTTAASFTDTTQQWRLNRWTGAYLQTEYGFDSQAVKIQSNTDQTVTWYVAPQSWGAGNTYILTQSKLGTTSKLYSRRMLGKGAIVTYWPQPNASATRVQAFKDTFAKIRPAGTVTRWASGSAYTAETTASQLAAYTSGSTSFAVRPDGSIYNVRATNAYPTVVTGEAT